MASLLEKLEAIEAGIAPGPWSVPAIYSAIRHVQRNTDVMESAIEDLEEGEPKGLPDRYDGAALGELRNLLPEIIAELRKVGAL